MLQKHLKGVCYCTCVLKVVMLFDPQSGRMLIVVISSKKSTLEPNAVPQMAT